MERQIKEAEERLKLERKTLSSNEFRYGLEFVKLHTFQE